MKTSNQVRPNSSGSRSKKQVTPEASKDRWCAMKSKRSAKAAVRGAQAKTNDVHNENSAPADRHGGLPLELVDSLAALQRRVNEAGALALVNADVMKTGVDDDAEWEAFADEPEKFSDGIHGLAWHCVSRLNCCLEDCAAFLKKAVMLAPVLGVKTGRRDTEDCVLQSGFEKADRIGKAVYALHAILETQSVVMSARNVATNVFALVEFAMADLEAAYDVFYKAQHTYMRGLVGEVVEERRAA